MAALSRPLPRVALRVEIADRDITADLMPFLISLVYSDKVEGESDSLDISLENTDQRWLNGWYPQKGDRLRCEIRPNDGSPALRPNDFEIDEIRFDGPPDVLTLRGIGAGVSKPQRTKQGRAYEDTTLAAIAQAVAIRLRLQLVGEIEPIRIHRVTQIYENDLAFLKRLAAEYGYAFSVKGSKLVFYKHASLRSASSVLTLSRSDLSRFSGTDKLMDVVSNATVSYHDAKSKRLRHQTVRDTSHKASADSAKLNVRAESDEQAAIKAQAQIDAASLDATVLTASTPGNTMLLAGINITLTDLGKLGGVWHVISATHRVDRGGGHDTDIECKRVRLADAEEVDG